jgi:hypothetical protein
MISRFFPPFLAVLAPLAFAVFSPITSQAQETGSIQVRTSWAEEASGVAMVSCINDGEVFSQTETRIGAISGCYLRGRGQLPVGVYDVRIEGEGIITEVKRGILVTAGNQNEIWFSLQLGEGIHIVEYSVGGLAREEVAVRLGLVERRIADLMSLPTIQDSLEARGVTVESASTKRVSTDCDELGDYLGKSVEDMSVGDLIGEFVNDRGEAYYKCKVIEIRGEQSPERSRVCDLSCRR